jgi:TonB family protein
MHRFSTTLCAAFLLSVVGLARGQENSVPSSSDHPLTACGDKNPPPCVDKPPIATHNPPPKYSKEAEDAKIEGVVVVQGVVGTDGRLHEVKVARALGYGLDEEAIKCVEKWRFKPGKSSGKPVPVVIDVEVRFVYPWK